MKPATPSKEQEILFAYLKGDLPENFQGIDTGILFKLFRRHRLFPLAQDLLPLLEGREKEKWSEAIRQGSLKSLAFVSRLVDIIDTLEPAGIEAIPLKGPVLAQALYKDVSQRHARDLDLLVSRADIMHSLEILQNKGYELKLPRKNLSKKQWKRYFRQQYDVPLVHREDGSLLELHTRIAYPGLLGGQEHLITQDVETLELAGKKVRSFSREATFLYLAIHGAHHLFFRLFWLRDLAEALNRWDLDHKAIAASAGQMGAERMLGIGLLSAERYFGSQLPDIYGPMLSKHATVLNRMEARCCRAICEAQFYSRKGRANLFWFYMDLKKGWRHKLFTLTSVFYRWYIRKILIS